MGVFTDGYSLHKQQQISYLSRRVTSMEELQSQLRKRGIVMNFGVGMKRHLSFSTKRNFRMTSQKGKDRVFTRIIERRVEYNSETKRTDKEIQDLKGQINSQYDRFERAKQNREQATEMHRQDIFRSKDF